MKTLRFFMVCLKMALSEQMAYKSNFLIRTITLMSFDLIIPFVTILIYLNTAGFPGWTFSQIIVFQGTFIFINAVDRLFFQKVDWTFSYDVRTGNFDRYLLYPVNTLTYLSFTNLGVEHFADFCVGLIMIGYGLILGNISLSIQGLSFFIAYVALAILFIISLRILKYSLILRAVRIGRVGELFRSIKYYGQFPADIYGRTLSSVLRFIFPLAVIAYYPSSALLGMVYENIILIALVILGIFIVSLRLWGSTLKHYTSAGG